MKLSTIIGVLFYCLINSAEAIVNYGRAADGFRLSGAATTLRSVNIGECVDLLGESASSNNRFSSVRIDRGFFCQFFVNVGCQINNGGVLGVNAGAVRDFDQTFNNRVSSFRCFSNVGI